jgi:hypothetical protein
MYSYDLNSHTMADRVMPDVATDGVMTETVIDVAMPSSLMVAIEWGLGVGGFRGRVPTLCVMCVGIFAFSLAITIGLAFSKSPLSLSFSYLLYFS